jgi:hypothetical protein
MELGQQYRYRYIAGDLFMPKYLERTGTYIKESNDKKYYIFASELVDIAKFFIVYVLKTDVLEKMREIEIEQHIVDMINLFLLHQTDFVTIRMNSHSPIQYIKFTTLNSFILQHFCPGTGIGYLEAAQSWNKLNHDDC